MSGIFIRPITAEDLDQVQGFLIREWGDIIQVRSGTILHPDQYPGFIAHDEHGKWIGLVTYEIRGDECEIISINSMHSGCGIGTALIEAARDAALQANCKRLWLITTNDNLRALRFYQKRGFRLAALHLNALEESRKLKPQIPLLGNDGIPLRDEIELTMSLPTS